MQQRGGLDQPDSPDSSCIATRVAEDPKLESPMIKGNRQVPPPWGEDADAAFIAASKAKLQWFEKQKGSPSPERPSRGSQLGRLFRLSIAIAIRMVSVIYAFFKRRF